MASGVIEIAGRCLECKTSLLKEPLASFGSALVAYSGGVDSAYLAWAARQALGDKMLAVLADSASLAGVQKRPAMQFSSDLDIPLEVIRTEEFENQDYTQNAPDRCFHCKDELFGKLAEIGRGRGFAAI